jgi:protoporphyrinogen oxidase
MKKIAVIGAGISGLSIAQCLMNRYQVKIFESTSKPGGLIKCERIKGDLYHIVGGHVFNSKRQDVLDWFWNFFDRDHEFVKIRRNASVFIDKPIGYPIENHVYELEIDLQRQIVNDLIFIATNKISHSNNFEDFLKHRFGTTLYEIYFKPYNEKIWRQDLSSIPLEWLEGKLPMPTVEEIIINNFCKNEETSMVHSCFYYPKKDGSQFLADRLSEKLTIQYNTEIKTIRNNKPNNYWEINDEDFDLIIYTGNIKNLPNILPAEILLPYSHQLDELDYHGTTSVLCEIKENPYSWIYLPDDKCQSHRIICTGNFTESNNATANITATIEFTDHVDRDIIIQNLRNIPYSPKYIAHQYTQYTYPIQTADTRLLIQSVKDCLRMHNIYLLGRFAEWEYYNMDAAIGAAIDLSKIFCT